MELTFGFPRVLGQDLKVVDSAILLLGIYVAGQMMATPAKALLENGLVEKVLGQPSVNLFREKKPRIRGFLFPGFYKPLPGNIQEKVLARAESENVKATGEVLFLHVRYNPEILENEKLIARLHTFLNKYGFTRNLAFTSFVLGVVFLAKARLVSSADLGTYGLVSLIAGILLLYRYLKFYRQYTYELLNTYAGGISATRTS